MKRTLMFFLAVCITVSIGLAQMSHAYETAICGRPLTLFGYITQEVDYGMNSRSHFETQSGLNSFLTTAMLEVGYMPTDNLKLFTSGYFEADWAYEILGGGRNNQWDAKGFSESRHHQYLRDDWNDWLREAHVTYTTPNFYLRVGKQIVQWGESNAQVTNRVNPIDQRRGPTDVKLDNSILPNWLVRAEYNTKVNSTFIQDFGLQFIIDPAFKFRGNAVVLPGTDWQGVFNPNVNLNIGLPPFLSPDGSVYVGQIYSDIEKPNDFDLKYWSYGLRMRAEVQGTIFHLMGYYGRDRDYVANGPGAFIDFAPNPSGRPILHPVTEGYYPYYKFVGLTATRELVPLKVDFLGGVAPVARFESAYSFNTTHSTNDGSVNGQQFVKTDEMTLALALDWKVKIDWLNSKSYITINPEFVFQREMNFNHGYYESSPGTYSRVTMNNRGTIGDGLQENNYQYSLLLMTSYFHNKLSPIFAWGHNNTSKSDFLMGKLSFAPNQNWTYNMQYFFFQGTRDNDGNNPMRNHDKILGSITYTFD
jgi:hypothetical protein